MKMIRWWGLITFIVIVGIIAIFNIFFLDKIIERTVERQASLALGARVDIGDIALKFFGLSVSIHDIKVTNPDEPLRNIIETKEITFDLAAGPLLRKKVVIEKLAVKDIALNTERKTSGALPDRLKKKEEAIQKFPSKENHDECTLPDFSVFKNLKEKSPEDLLSGVSLMSSEFLADHRKKVSDTRQSWEEKMAKLPTKESIEADLKTLGAIIDKQPDDISKMPAYLDKLNKIRTRLTDAKTLLAAAQKDFRSDISSLKQSLSPKEIENLKANDLRSVMAGLDMEIPSSEGLVCVVLGKKITRMVTRAIAWYRKLNDFMPAGKQKNQEEKPTTVPRMKGVDIRFPITTAYPDLLVKQADFSASQTQKVEAKALSFSRLSGNIQGLTTQPAIYGKPARIDLTGALSSGAARSISLKGALDRRNAPADDSFSLTINDFKVKPEGATAFEKSPIRLSSAEINAISDVQVKGENLKGRVYFTVLNPIFDIGPEADMLKDLFQNIGTFDITISLSGTLENVSMSLSSSLAGMMRTRLKDIIQNQMEGIENKLMDIIASRIHDNIIDSIRDTDSLEDTVLGQLSERISLAGKGSQEKKGDTKQPVELLKKGLPLPF